MHSKGVSEPEAYAELRRKAMAATAHRRIAEAWSTAHDLMGSGGMTEHLTIGFLPLVDACLPILAHEHGFAEEEGVALRFQRDVSWATVLDRLLYGHSDAAHLIAPLAIATTLGRGRPAAAAGGAVRTGAQRQRGDARPPTSRRASPSRASWPIRCSSAPRWPRKRGRARPPGQALTFGVVHRYRATITCCATGSRRRGSARRRVEMPRSRRRSSPRHGRGEIDGACVGEPWNSAAVERGVGTIVLATAQIWRRGVEKVLAFRAPVLEGAAPGGRSTDPAMRKAGAHFVDRPTGTTNAAILARPSTSAPTAQILGAISDRLTLVPGPLRSTIPTSCSSTARRRTSRGSARPNGSTPAGSVGSPRVLAADAEAAARVFRPDIYRSALAGTGDLLPAPARKSKAAWPCPPLVTAQQGTMVLANNAFFDGRSFDPR
jgi:NitT/TauT family transport system ATP-binding protein